MRCYCYLRNIVDLLHGSVTPYEKRFGLPFRGPVYPFGCQVVYTPTSIDDQNRSHPFGFKQLDGIFFGYALQQGCGWTGNLLILDWEQVDKAERTDQIYPRVIPASQVRTIHRDNTSQAFIFPLAERMLNQPHIAKDSPMTPQQLAQLPPKPVPPPIPMTPSQQPPPSQDEDNIS